MSSLARLRAIRQSNGWSQIDVAAAAGTTPRTVSRIERCEIARMEIGTLVRVAEACGLSIVDLVPALAARPARALLRPRGAGSV